MNTVTCGCPHGLRVKERPRQQMELDEADTMPPLIATANGWLLLLMY